MPGDSSFLGGGCGVEPLNSFVVLIAVERDSEDGTGSIGAGAGSSGQAVAQQRHAGSG